MIFRLWNPSFPWSISKDFPETYYRGLIKEKEYDELDPDLLTIYMKLTQMTLQYQEYARCYHMNMFQQIDQEEANSK